MLHLLLLAALTAPEAPRRESRLPPPPLPPPPPRRRLTPRQIDLEPHHLDALEKAGVIEKAEATPHALDGVVHDDVDAFVDMLRKANQAGGPSGRRGGRGKAGAQKKAARKRRQKSKRKNRNR